MDRREAKRPKRHFASCLPGKNRKQRHFGSVLNGPSEIMSSEELPPRESMEFDVVIVGAGPSGLSAAIRLKQLNADLNIVVVEKGSEVGAHILSGMVMDPVALDKLIPYWREDSDCPLKTEVKDDRFYWMTAGGAIKLPNFMMPPLMSNHHNYIGSLGPVGRGLPPQARARGGRSFP